MAILGVPREIRGLVVKHTTDIDMKNAHPVLLVYLCKLYSYACPEVQYCVNNREAILSQMPDRNEGKILYLEAMNKNKITPEIKAFSKEVIKLLETVGGKTWNKSGSFLNKCLCITKTFFLQQVRSFLKFNDYIIRFLAFDGVMIDGDHYNDKALLIDIDNDVNAKFEGLNMEFDFKEHDDTLVIPDEFKIDEKIKTPEIVGIM